LTVRSFNFVDIGINPTLTLRDIRSFLNG
jgi:hypothetical protein